VTCAGAADSSLTELSAAAAVTAIRNGDIKAEDYARALLDRAQRLTSLNAFRTLHPEVVLEAARDADKQCASGAQLGVLHGLPIPVKDSINTKALPTSNGTRALANFKPKDDAAVLKPLFDQGAILMGKTNLHELSFGWTSNNAFFGAVRNPYDSTRILGGSSGGSAAAVAARMAPRDRRGYPRLDPRSFLVLRTRGTKAQLRPLSRRGRDASHRQQVRPSRPDGAVGWRSSALRQRAGPSRPAVSADAVEGRPYRRPDRVPDGGSY
jgi:hypothetical protein